MQTHRKTTLNPPNRTCKFAIIGAALPDHTRAPHATVFLQVRKQNVHSLHILVECWNIKVMNCWNYSFMPRFKQRLASSCRQSRTAWRAQLITLCDVYVLIWARRVSSCHLIRVRGAACHQPACSKQVTKSYRSSNCIYDLSQQITNIR